MSREAATFLRRVWQEQPEGHAVVSVKDWDSGSWEDYEVPRTGRELPSLDDLYFAPNVFETPRRRKATAVGGRWLYADLDEVDPRDLDPYPTLAWETSPGRFQAMWLLTSRLKPSTLEALNQRLTYYVKADKGGWSLSKVLRVPGSFSNKREGARFKVKLLWDDGPEYRGSDILDKVREVETPSSSLGDLPELVLPKADAARLRSRHAGKLKIGTRKLLRATEANGDRSSVLWKLQRELLEAGIPPNQVFVMVKDTVWNKYAGQSREERQLWTEIQRAVSESSGAKETVNGTTSDSSPTQSRSRKLVKYADFISQQTRKPMWMVEGIWSESAHGILAGEPKTYKSVISTDLAVSVASGTAFLNHFPVPQIGPVFMIQKENDEAEVQDRVMRIAHSKALVGEASLNRNTLKINGHADLPLYHMNNEDFDLTNDTDIKWLRRQVRRLNPVLVILDPLYLLAPGVDENSAYEMTPILEKLLRIKQTYNCGTLLIHHYKKQDKANPTAGAARISGTGVFHRWFESALLLERTDREEAIVKMVPEHRGHKPGGAVWAEFDLGSDTDLHYSVDISRNKEGIDGTEETILNALNNGVGLLTLNEVASQLHMTTNGAKRKLQKMGVETVQAKVNGRRQTVIRRGEDQ